MGTTTLKDYGRSSQRHGDIPFYYGFPFRFWFAAHQLAPEDVETWCRENCVGYYKTVSYTHKDSVRLRNGQFDSKVIYIDKIYLQDEADAKRVALMFDVKDTVVKRVERLKPRRKKKKAKAA